MARQASSKRSTSTEEAPSRRTRTKSTEEAPVKRTRSKVVDEAPSFNPYAQLDGVLDDIEKSVGLSDSSMDPSEQRLSTGNLMLDIILGGGITAGWYTNFGQEQSCKTTGAVTILTAALNSEVPILSYMDFEGSASADYLENIMHNMGVKSDAKSVFGIRDEKSGKWLVAPRVRYKSEAVAEKFFDYLARLQRMLPDKKKIGENWYYLYVDTKENRKVVGSSYDVNYWRKTKMLRVPAKDGSLQALVLVDSYPAMLPEKLDVDDPNNAMAAQARMFSDQLKRVKGKMRAKRIAVIGINQLRLRPMVAYGCLHASTKIPFTDGSSHTIRDIVDNKIRGNVWAYAEKTQTLVEKPITAWHNNGQLDSPWNVIETQSGRVLLTDDHLVLTSTGWKKAIELRLTDRLLHCDGYQQIVTIGRECSTENTKYDISVEDCENYLAGGDCGFIVHNSPEYEPGGEALKLYSDVRLKWSSRALSAVGKWLGEGIKGEGQIEEEACLHTKHGTDNYRYIHVRGHKNKLSRPYLEGWLRLWISNSKGEAQGFDPVFDTFAYLKSTGQVEGKRNKMLLKFKGNEAKKSISWMDFKQLILGNRADIKEICISAGMKPVDLRAKCFLQMASGAGLELYNQNDIAARATRASRKAEDADSEEEDDDND
jgi:RecA/RadA recombinase